MTKEALAKLILHTMHEQDNYPSEGGYVDEDNPESAIIDGYFNMLKVADIVLKELHK